MDFSFSPDLLIQDQAEIQKEYESLGFTLLDSKVSGEWISIVFLANEKNYRNFINIIKMFKI